MLRILIAGDFCLHDRMQNMTCEQIVQTMQCIQSYTNRADYSIVNLESAISERAYEPIQKSGIHLLNGSKMIKAIKALGFSAVTLANNHFADFGPEAVTESIKILNECEIDYVGAGNNLREAQMVLYKKFENDKIAIINCCEHEFSIAGDNFAGSNPIDIVDITNSIIEAKKNSDKVLVIIHGGTEHYNLPTPRMQKTYRYFIDQGADVVVNHHQHCFSGYEYYKGSPIIYGLGNFCFDMNGTSNKPWNEGYMVELDIEEQISIEIVPYKQCDEFPGIQVLQNRKEFKQKIERLNQTISDTNLVNIEYQKLKERKRDEYLYFYNQPQNRAIRRLAKKGLLSKKLQNELLPTFLTKEKALCLLNLFQCEAHRELMIDILQDYINDVV